ncbi:MAG: BamA/TamA family outer membrane protein [Myxococcota bacterium]
MSLLLLTTLAFANPADPAPSTDVPAEERDDDQPWRRVGWGFGAVPAVNFNTDDGFGFGAVASIYRYDGQTSPYRTALTVILFATTKAVQDHSIRLDALRVGNLPLRLNGRLTFRAYRSDNFCGFGNAVTCDPAVPEALLPELNLPDEEAEEDFLRRYYLTRYINPNVDMIGRWEVDPMPHRFEVIGAIRALTLRPGDFQTATPYPNSLYAEVFPEGERGFLGVIQAGVMLDNRDNEPAPIRGYWLEGSIRGASRLWGSDWDFFGFNVTSRTYVPLGTDRLVWANRVVVDGKATNSLPILELAMPGGTQRYFTFGWLNAGRGIRQKRFIGEALVMEQAELRWTALPLKVARIPVDIGVLGFVDLGFVGADLSEFGTMFDTPLVGTGGGLRVAVDKNFIIRADVGVSPTENYAPRVYIDLNNTF